MQRVPLSIPWLGNDEAKAVERVLLSKNLIQGIEVAAFEAEFAEYLGVRNAVAVSSGTTALQLALLTLDLPKGSDILVPAFTFIATANAAATSGLQPRFCDINLTSFNCDSHSIRATLDQADSPNISAGMLVHQFGNALHPDVFTAATVNNERIPVLEDAACALGSMSGDDPCGTIGVMGCFSFHPRKVITTGEGGMIVTQSALLAERLRVLRNHGNAGSNGGVGASMPPGLLPDFIVPGYNYRMTEMAAAIGRVQLKRLPEILERRRALALRYSEAFVEGLPWLQTPPVPSTPKATNWQSYVCRISLPAGKKTNDTTASACRNRLMAELHAQGIGCSQGTHALHLQGAYREGPHLPLPNAAVAAATSITLPLFPELSFEDQDLVINALRTFTP